MDFLENVEGASLTEKMENFSKLFVEKHSTDEEVHVDSEVASVLLLAGYLDTSGLDNKPKESTLCGKTSYETKIYIYMEDESLWRFK